MVPRSVFASLRALRHPAYRTLWIGAFVSNIGTWMETVALGIYVTQVTGKAGWTGTVAALTYLPAMFLAPIGGVLGDRFDRRKYLAWGTGADIFLAGLITWLSFTGKLSVAAVAIVATVSGCVHALRGPAFTALLVELVPQEDLLSALNLSSAQYNLGRVLGPMAAAMAIVAGGLPWTFALNTASFLAVLIALTVLKVPASPEVKGPPAPLWAGIWQGVRTARDDPGIRTALLTTLAAAMLVAPFVGLVPAVAIKVFKGGAPATSALVTSQGLGAVAMALLAGLLAEKLGRRRLLKGSILALGAISAAYWLSPRLPVAMGSIFLLGALYLSVITGSNTVCQSRSPRALQARMSSLFNLLLGGGYALGLVAMGWAGDRFGLPLTGAVASALFLSGAAALLWFRPELFDALDWPGDRRAPKRTVTLPTLDGPIDQAALATSPVKGEVTAGKPSTR